MTSFLRIGGITIGIHENDGRLAMPLADPMRRFEIQDGNADLNVEVGVLEDYAPPAGPLLFDSGAVWKLYEDGGRYRIECRSELFGPTPYKIALIDRQLGGAEVKMRMLDRGISHPLEFPIDELLFNAMLVARGGVELHSCGVVDKDGRAFLFAGNSGDGKTTTARLWQGEAADIVSDDRVILRREHDGWWMYGTPWHGEADICSSSRARLTAVYLLAKSNRNSIETMSASAAVARLLACAFPPFHDRGGLTSVVSTLSMLTREVPVARLSFTKTPDVVSFVRNALQVAA
jgi:hypothetical protein